MYFMEFSFTNKMLTAKSRYTYGCNGPEDALFRATSNPTKKPADPSAVFTQYETGCPGDVQLLKNALTASVFVDTMSQSSIIPIRVIAVVITPIRTASFKLFVYEKHYKRSP